MRIVDNPCGELREVIQAEVAALNGNPGYAEEIYTAIRDWMNESGIVFYQP